MRGRGQGYRAGWRRTGWALLGGAVLTGTAVGVPGPARASNPNPPGAGSVSAAAGQVSKQASALSAARVQLAAANARLASLRTQSEVVIERYDKTMVSLQQARTAYQAAMARLARASTAQAAAHRRVASLAAQAYEAGGGAGSMAAMLGNAGGPQAYLQGANDERQLARQRGDLLSQNRAATVVADVFRRQARQELTSEQTAARRAAALKTAIAAAIARQQGAVASIKAATQQLEAKLGKAKAHEYQLQQARQAAGRSRSPATAIPAPVAAGGSSYGGWPSSYSLSQGASAAQGNIAANWALSQIGKPYQWGGAGPQTYDCSGLSMDAWARAGVKLLHWTGYQWPSGPHVPVSQLRRGDLLFFATNTTDPDTIHHVGIYIGNGQMVDAPYTGVDVRIDSIYQPGGLIGATRPAG
ncbi:MAG TPA: NlpC/P60 family protein [Streptosporangiaceae bacterium]|jgi:cell wall-associated NlpC family hydrolase